MLPVMETPTFYVEMIGNKERVKFRPFLVREEKLLIKPPNLNSKTYSTTIN